MSKRVWGRRATGAVFATLLTVCVTVLAFCLWRRAWDKAFTAALALCLLFIPFVIERFLSIRIPPALRLTACVFVVCAGILGEIADFYTRFAWFDDLLHTCSGVMFAAFGFCLAFLLAGEGGKTGLPAPVVAFLAFFFSNTVGVAWELLEYGADRLLGTDMQKDTLIGQFGSVLLASPGGPRVHRVREIASTVIRAAGGERITLAGYLDVGLVDTMSDLFFNMLGAALFCAAGYAYLKHRRCRWVKGLLPVAARKTEFWQEDL